MRRSAPSAPTRAGELLGVVDAQGLVVDPGIEHDVGEAIGACRGPGPRNGAVTSAGAVTVAIIAQRQSWHPRSSVACPNDNHC